MSAADFAKGIDPTATVTAAELERAALERIPGHVARLDEIVASAAAKMRGRRDELIEGMRAGARERAPRVPWWRSLALIVSVLSAAGAFALYFSRADLDDVPLPLIAMPLLVLAAVAYAVSALPIRRVAPPPSGVAFTGWVITGLGAATVIFSGYLVARFEPEFTGWLVVGIGSVGILAVLTIASWWARRGMTPADPGRAEGGAWVEDLRRTAVGAYEDAMGQAAGLFAELTPADRAGVEADMASAREALSATGRDVPAFSSAPGGAVVRSDLESVAISVGVRLPE